MVDRPPETPKLLYFALSLPKMQKETPSVVVDKRHFFYGGEEGIRTFVRFNPQTDFEQLSHRLSLSLTIPNFRKNYRISDRFLAPSEKNARLMQGQRDGRSLLSQLNVIQFTKCVSVFVSVVVYNDIIIFSVNAKNSSANRFDLQLIIRPIVND